MTELNCPHCNGRIRPLNMDVDMTDEAISNVNCPNCDRDLDIVTHVSISFVARCMEGDHDFVQSDYLSSLFTCSRCHQDRFVRHES